MAYGATLNSVDRGDLVSCIVTFTNAAGVPTDPTTITVSTINPTGAASQTNYVYPTTGLTRTSAGVYELQFTATMAGVWIIRAVGTGAVAQVVQGIVRVDADVFSP